MIDILTYNELPLKERVLVLEARNATRFSHSPYSKFCVGCALCFGGDQDLDDQKIVVGTNYENASFGLTICAERSAIFHANSIGKRNIRRLAVTAHPQEMEEGWKGSEPVCPCGACRQVIQEAEDLAGVRITILMDCYDNEKIYRVFGVGALLPFAFGPVSLGINLRQAATA